MPGSDGQPIRGHFQTINIMTLRVGGGVRSMILIVTFPELVYQLDSAYIALAVSAAKEYLQGF